jgi:hypothetical protein
MRRLTWLCLCLIVLLLPVAASAAPIIYTDRASFEAALSDVVVYDLNDGAEPIRDFALMMWTLDYDGLDVITDTSDGKPDTANSGTVSALTHAIMLKFETPQTAIGFDFTSTSPFSAWGLATIAGSGFFGIVLDTPTQYFQLAPYGPTLTIDNVTTVPEPSTLLLTLIGTTVFCRVRRS